MLLWVFFILFIELKSFSLVYYYTIFSFIYLIFKKEQSRLTFFFKKKFYSILFYYIFIFLYSIKKAISVLIARICNFCEYQLMNRTPTTSETNSAKSPPQAVFNYAEAAKRSSQIQDQQQSPRTQSPSSTSGNNNDSNKKGNNNTNGAVNGTTTTQSAVNTQQPQQQASFASTVASATNSYPFFIITIINILCI